MNRHAAEMGHRPRQAMAPATLMMALLMMALPLGLAPAQAGPMLSPASSTLTVGDTLTLTLTDDIPDPNDIAAFQLAVDFDHTLLALTGVATATGLNAPPGWDTPVFNPANGLVSVGGTCDFVLLVCSSVTPGSDVPLLTFTFDVLASSPSPTSVTVATDPELGPDPATDYPGTYVLAPTTASATLNARAIPAPGMSSLLLPALALAGLVARRRRAA